MKRILFTVIMLGSLVKAFAQKGNNELQLGTQLNIPSGQFSDATTLGYGFSAKVLFGFSEAPQQVSFEAGYNRFGIKESLLPAGVSAQYRSWPIYTGYRYHFSNFYLESQAGISINTVYASTKRYLASDTKGYFAWALSVGYSIDKLDLAVKYQSSDLSDGGGNLTFIGLRAAYRFQFNRSRHN